MCISETINNDSRWVGRLASAIESFGVKHEDYRYYPEARSLSVSGCLQAQSPGR